MTRGSRVGKEILHEEWERCSETVIDEYWKAKYAEMARGKFPANCFYSAGTLSYHSKDKDSVEFNVEDVDSMIRSSKSFFYKYCSMSNYSGKRKRRPQYIDIEKWSKCDDISKSNLIEKYVNTVAECEDLTPEARDKLFDIVHNGIKTKSVNILMENSEIYEIEGLYWDEKTETHYTVINNPIDIEELGGSYVTKAKKEPPKKMKLTSYEKSWIKGLEKTSLLLKKCES